MIFVFVFQSLELSRFLVSNQFPADQNEMELHSSTMHLLASCKSGTFSAPLLLPCRRGKLGMCCSGVPPPPASHCPCLPKTSSLSLLCPPPPSSLALLSSFLPEVHAASSPLVQFLPSLCSLFLSCYFASLSFPLFSPSPSSLLPASASQSLRSSSSFLPSPEDPALPRAPATRVHAPALYPHMLCNPGPATHLLGLS